MWRQLAQLRDAGVITEAEFLRSVTGSVARFAQGSLLKHNDDSSTNTDPVPTNLSASAVAALRKTLESDPLSCYLGVRALC